MIVKNKTVSRQVGEFLKSELKKVGIEVILETVSFPELLKRATKGDYDIFYLSWYVGLPKGLEFFELLYGKNYPGSYNRFGYQSNSFDEIFQEARQTLSEKKQSHLVSKLNKIAIKDFPFMPLVHQRSIFIRKNNLRNFIPSNQMGGLEKFYEIKDNKWQESK